MARPAIWTIIQYVALTLLPPPALALDATPLPGALHIQAGGWRAICWQVISDVAGVYMCQPLADLPRTVCHLAPGAAKLRCEALLDRAPSRRRQEVPA